MGCRVGEGAEGASPDETARLVLVQMALDREDTPRDGKRSVDRAEEGEPAHGKGRNDAHTEAADGEEARGGRRVRAQAAGEKVAEECGREVEAHLLEIEREGEGDGARERPAAHRPQGRPQR